MFPLRHHREGFSLLEISIVLVVIGLLAGGIVVGREMIQSAEIRRTLTQLDQFRAMANNFIEKYNCTPGDCATAATSGLGTNGDGDNHIADYTSSHIVSYIYDEEVNFWQHLIAAKMISLDSRETTGHTYFLMPKAALGHGFWKVTTDNYGAGLNDGRTVFRITEEYDGNYVSNQARCNNETYCPALSPAEVYKIDAKIDDGIPGSGQVALNAPYTYGGQWWSQGVVTTGAAGATNDVCVVITYAPNFTYNIANNRINLCMIEIDAGF